jgi:hypothetical protein
MNRKGNGFRTAVKGRVAEKVHASNQKGCILVEFTFLLLDQQFELFQYSPLDAGFGLISQIETDEFYSKS